MLFVNIVQFFPTDIRLIAAHRRSGPRQPLASLGMTRGKSLVKCVISSEDVSPTRDLNDSIEQETQRVGRSTEDKYFRSLDSVPETLVK
jgi:hypothetical protein